MRSHDGDADEQHRGPDFWKARETSQAHRGYRAGSEDKKWFGG